MMKKLLVVLIMLALATMANAALHLSFNGDTDVEEAYVNPSDYFIIDVYSDSTEALEFWVNITGDASYVGAGTLYAAAPSTMEVANYSRLDISPHDDTSH
jgi:hypothetical protein